MFSDLYLLFIWKKKKNSVIANETRTRILDPLKGSASQELDHYTADPPYPDQ